MLLCVWRFYFIHSILYRVYIFSGCSHVTEAFSEKAVYVVCLKIVRVRLEILSSVRKIVNYIFTTEYL